MEEILLHVEVHALLHVGELEDLLDGVVAAVVDEVHHQLVVGDLEGAEPPEARARVHEEGEQHPALRVEHVLAGEARRVGLVDRLHHVEGHAGEGVPPAEMVVHHPGRGGGFGVDDLVRRGLPAGARHLARVVVEGEVHPGDVGEVGGDVVVRDLHLPVLHVLGVDELDLLDEALLLQEDGADEAVEVAARDETVLPLRGFRHGLPPVARACTPARGPRTGSLTGARAAHQA